MPSPALTEDVLNVCGLEPPEPLERVLDALDRLVPGKTLHMLIDREPRPLYRILQRNGYRYQAVLRDDGRYEIAIQTAAPCSEP